MAHYCATKAAVISYTQSAALALASHKIRVNAISPGVIDTPMWKTVIPCLPNSRTSRSARKGRGWRGRAARLYGAPFRSRARCRILASDQSQYMTAQTISVDGGNVLR